MKLKLLISLGLIVLLVGTVAALQKNSFALDENEFYISSLVSTGENLSLFDYSLTSLEKCFIDSFAERANLQEGEEIVQESIFISLDEEEYLLYSYFLYLKENSYNITIFYNSEEEVVRELGDFFRIPIFPLEDLDSHSVVIISNNSNILGSSFSERDSDSSFSIVFNEEPSHLEAEIYGEDLEKFNLTLHLFLDKIKSFDNFDECAYIISDIPNNKEPLPDNFVGSLRTWISDTDSGLVSIIIRIIRAFIGR